MSLPTFLSQLCHTYNFIWLLLLSCGTTEKSQNDGKAKYSKRKKIMSINIYMHVSMFCIFVYLHVTKVFLFLLSLSICHILLYFHALLWLLMSKWANEQLSGSQNIFFHPSTHLCTHIRGMKKHIKFYYFRLQEKWLENICGILWRMLTCRRLANVESTWLFLGCNVYIYTFYTIMHIYK